MSNITSIRNAVLIDVLCHSIVVVVRVRKELVVLQENQQPAARG
jgi:hypothetical protein